MSAYTVDISRLRVCGKLKAHHMVQATTIDDVRLYTDRCSTSLPYTTILTETKTDRCKMSSRSPQRADKVMSLAITQFNGTGIAGIIMQLTCSCAVTVTVWSREEIPTPLSMLSDR